MARSSTQKGDSCILFFHDKEGLLLVCVDVFSIENGEDHGDNHVDEGTGGADKRGDGFQEPQQVHDLGIVLLTCQRQTSWVCECCFFSELKT